MVYERKLGTRLLLLWDQNHSHIGEWMGVRVTKNATKLPCHFEDACFLFRIHLGAVILLFFFLNPEKPDADSFWLIFQYFYEETRAWNHFANVQLVFLKLL